MSIRSLARWLAALALLAWQLTGQAQGPARELRIGYQKSASILVLQKASGSLDRKLAPLGVAVRWIEFPAGPQLLEGLNVGAVDLGYVGEAPPVFAQAAGAKFVYVGFDPASPRAEAIVVPRDSPLKTVGDLKGRKVALNKGSNVHYLLVRLLEQSGLKYQDVQTVFLPPADARAAFEKGAVDAWVIWDPFLAAAEKQSGARILADGTGAVSNHQFYLAERGYAERNGAVLQAVFEDLADRGRWIQANPHEAAKVIAPIQALEPDVVEASLRRYVLGVKPLTPAVVAEQQKLADTFFTLKLIPRPVQVRDAVWDAR